MNTALLLWGVLFSSLGLGFFVYAKKQSAFVPMICGIGLMVVPYFLSSTIALVLVGVVLCALPYFVRI